MNEQTRLNRIELIRRLARGRMNDPDIAYRLGIPVGQVRALRKAAGIPAGERRWLHPSVRERDGAA